MTTAQSFLSVLQSKASQVQAQRQAPKPTAKISQPAPTPEVTPEPEAPSVTVERVINRNRLDVSFSAKPAALVRADLRVAGFRWNEERSSWYHADTAANRAFLTDKFGADFGPEATPETPAMPAIDLQVAPELTDETASPEFQRFRQQTNELMAELQIDAADLMLRAIDCLHKQTFGRN